MTNERLKKYRMQKEKIGVVKYQIKELTSTKQKIIEKEQNDIIQLKKHESLAGLTYDLYDNIREDKLDEMDDEEYNSIIDVGNYAASSSATYNALIENVESIELDNIKTTGTLDATASNLWSGNRILIDFSKNSSNYFEDAESIIKEYDPDDDFNKQIEFIMKQLPLISPDISNDFDNFIKQFLSTDSNETKYQELIGFRSSLFLKIIFPFSEKIFGKNKPTDRRLDIERFVCTGKALDAADVPIIIRAYNLYKFLSTNIKEGKTTPRQNENTFYESVSVTYALLKLKDKYSKMS